MGIYITGMEMPQDREIILRIDEKGEVYVYGTYPTELHKAIPVPTPHGDLIDRDEARATIKPWSPEDERSGCTFDTVKKLMHTMLYNAPTIIPAEEVNP